MNKFQSLLFLFPSFLSNILHEILSPHNELNLVRAIAGEFISAPQAKSIFAKLYVDRANDS